MFSVILWQINSLSLSLSQIDYNVASYISVLPSTDCGTLQFTPSLRSQQNGTAPL